MNEYAYPTTRGRIEAGLVFGAIAMLLSLGLASTDVSAQSGWQAEWNKIVAAARKEGKVTVLQGGNPHRRKWMVNQFKKDYPRITPDFITLPGRQGRARIATERRVEKFLWDVFFAGPNTGFWAADAGYLDPLRPEFILPEVKDPKVWGGWDTAFYDKKRKYILAYLNDLAPMWYNAKMIPPAKVKKLGIKILLDPAYKGKILWHDPRVFGAGGHFAFIIYTVLGEAGLKKVIVDQKSVFYRSGNDATEAMVRGKGAIYLGPVLSDRLRRYEKAGMKFDMRAFGNGREVGYLGTDGITVGVFNRRPHPNATKVFLNWVLSKRISAALAKIQQMNSRRKDIANVTGRILKPGVKYIESQRNEATPVFRKVRKILKKLRP